jgi:hypothetical protein
MTIKDKIILGMAFVCGCILTFFMGWIMFDGIPMIVEVLKKMNDSKAKWPKALMRKSLRQGPAAAFDANYWDTTTYDFQKNMLDF